MIFAATDVFFGSPYEPRNNGCSWYARRSAPNRRLWSRRACRCWAKYCNQRWPYQLYGQRLTHGDGEVEENLINIGSTVI